jgi:thioredoxin 1
MSTQNRSYLTLTDQNFQQEVIQSSEPVLVDFWATWCGPCKVMNPVIQDLANEYAGQVTVGKVNVDEHPQTAAQYGIQSIPTIKIFRNGKMVDQVIGAVPKNVLVAKLNEILKPT